MLDEPTAGMDPEARAATRAIVADLRAAGAAILLTSHDLTDVERLADRICILDRGRIVAAGTAAELGAGVAAALRFSLDRPLAPADLEALRAAVARSGRARSLTSEGDGAHYRISGVVPDAALVAALAAWCASADRLIVELRTAGGTLEDTYLALVGEHAEVTP